MREKKRLGDMEHVRAEAEACPPCIHACKLYLGQLFWVLVLSTNYHNTTQNPNDNAAI
jgi:hypothetical protein